MNDNDNAFGIRDGEVAIGLPDTFDASLYFIGRIRTPWTKRADCPKNARESDAVCTLEVDPRWAKALTHVESCTHLVVLPRMRANPMPSAPSNSIRGGRRRSPMSKVAPIWSCSIG